MNPDVSLGGDGVNFLWHEYEHQARVAIKAMQKPTRAMVQAAIARTDLDDEVKDGTIYPGIYRAMNDEALK